MILKYQIVDVVWLCNYWKYEFRQNQPIFFIIIFDLKSCLLFSAEFFTENSDIPVLIHHRTDALPGQLGSK